MLKTVLYHRQNSIGTITINRPNALNALNSEVITELERIVAMIESDADVRAVIITGTDRAFAAGADIEEMLPMGLEEGRKLARRGAALLRRIELLELPTIAAVNGYAIGGGCELAMSCDMILAGSKAKFGQPEVGLGIIPGYSGTQRLPRRIGQSRAMEMILTGEYINAEQAAQIGLVNRVTEPENLMAEAQALAEKIAKQAFGPVKYAKAAVSRGMQVDIDTGIAIENELFAMCFASEEQKLRMNGFINRKK